MSAEYITHDELNHALRDLVHEIQSMRRELNRVWLVLGTGQFIMFLVELLMLRMIGL
jgi:hypothetical protein